MLEQIEATQPSDANKLSHKDSKNSKHATKFNPRWTRIYNWLIFANGEMYCSLCKQAKKKNNWAIGNCNFREDLIISHERSVGHKDSVQIIALQKKNPNPKSILEPIITVDKTELALALKAMYHILKHERAFNHFESEMNFLELLDVATPVADLPRNASLRSERMKAEMVEVLGKTVRSNVLTEINLSPVYSVICDETCDISIKEQLIIYIKYLNAGYEPVTAFVGIVEITAGDATTIHTALTTFLFDDLQLDREKLVGFGSDGAAVMTGKSNGVAAKLRQQVSPQIINIHCVAHRLALAVGQSSNKIMKVKFVLDRADAIHRYYDASFVRSSGLRQIQEALGVEQTKLSQAIAVRWLSYDKAVSSLRKCYAAVVKSLNHEATHRSDAKACGFHKSLMEWDSILTLEVLSEVLPKLATLSKSLQTSNIDYGMVETLVKSTMTFIEAIIASKESFPAIVERATNVFDDVELASRPSSEQLESYKSKVFIGFLTEVRNGLESRFPTESLGILSHSAIFEANQFSSADDYGIDEIASLSEHFGINKEAVEEEWRHIKATVEALRSSKADFEERKLFPSLKSILKAHEHDAATVHLKRILCTYLVLPMSSVDCERGFSVLKLVKNRLRNRLLQINLNHAMMVAIEGPEIHKFKFSSAIAEFKKGKRRRVV